MRLGANRAISAAQLASSEAGATTRLGLRVLPGFVFQHQQQRQHLDGLAEPHVVGQAGTEPEPREQIEPLHTRLLIGTQRALKRFPGIDTSEPIRVTEARQRLREPRPGHGLAPVDGGRTGSSITGNAGPGQQTHGLAERQAFIGGPALDRLELFQRAARGGRDRPRPICRG